VQCVNNQSSWICFPSYAFSAQSADGDPIAEIKSPFTDEFWGRCGKIGNTRSKALDFKNYSANNADISWYCVLVDKK
jgi:hypothetical protein